MKKRVSALVLTLALLFSVSAAAAVPRVVNPIVVTPKITVSSAGAICSVKITSDSSGLTASGTVSLYRDGKFVTSWPVSSLKFSQTYTPVVRGAYRMDYDITVKGPAGSDHLTGSASDTY